MTNPNQYDDDAYTALVNNFAVDTDHIDALWKAGGSIENIADEIGNGLENTSTFEGKTVRVEITVED